MHSEERRPLELVASLAKKTHVFLRAEIMIGVCAGGEMVSFPLLQLVKKNKKRGEAEAIKVT